MPRRVPPRALAGGEPLALRLGEGWWLSTWNVTYRPYSDRPAQGGEDRRLARGRATDGDRPRRVTFEAPKAGDWRVTAFVRFAGPDGRGDITFDWRLTSAPETVSQDASSRDPAAIARAAALLGLPPVFAVGSVVVGRRFRRKDVIAA
jgi:hypothetical protein